MLEGISCKSFVSNPPASCHPTPQTVLEGNLCELWALEMQLEIATQGGHEQLPGGTQKDVKRRGGSGRLAALLCLLGTAPRWQATSSLFLPLVQ